MDSVAIRVAARLVMHSVLLHGLTPTGFEVILASMETVHFGRALYYPHIFPQSRQWLRTAALYHDGIGRIVPKSFVPSAYDRHSGPELLRDFEELQAAGFIEDKNPEDILSDVKEEFVEFLKPILGGPKEKERLRERLGSHDWKPYNMFRDKIAHGLIELLEPKGLVRPVNDYEVEFDASIGGLYMLFLARRMAKHQPIVSDDPIYEALTNMATQPDTIDVAADRGFLLANAIFTSAVPIDIESVDIRDLIKFREDFKGERIAFYEWIASFSADLAKIKDPKQLQQAVEHHAAVIEKRMSSLKDKLRLLKLKCGAGIFTFSMPGMLTSTWGLATKEPVLLLGGGALVLAGIVGNSVLENRITKAETPVSYVHSIRERLKPREYAGKMIQLNLSGI